MKKEPEGPPTCSGTPNTRKTARDAHVFPPGGATKPEKRRYEGTFQRFMGNAVSNPVLAGKRIAVIEDEVPINAMLEIMLDELGCVHAGTARTLTEALSLADTLDADDVDAVLLDYRLKGEASAPAAQQFRKRGIRVIVTTGVDDQNLPAELKDCASIRKPYGLELLEQGLVDALSGDALTTPPSHTKN